LVLRAWYFLNHRDLLLAAPCNLLRVNKRRLLKLRIDVLGVEFGS